MTEYEITIKRCGSVVKKVKVAADNALQAIETIEARYKTVSVKVPKLPSTLSQRGPATVAWTGYEFTAREAV